MMTQIPKPEDRRKFEAESPNDLWQSDVMHGPRKKISQTNVTRGQKPQTLLSVLYNMSGGYILSA